MEQWKMSVDPSPGAWRMVGFVEKVGAMPSTWLKKRNAVELG